VLFVSGIALSARGGLTDDQLKMLQDAGGWEYITVSDAHDGIQTKHTCFDGRPHPEECSGTLTFHSDKTFVQSVHIHGQTVQRHGNYELDGDELSFYDEFGTRDGPYTIDIDTEKKSMTMEMPQVRIELELKRALAQR
jgi:hypothetical protein